MLCSSCTEEFLKFMDQVVAAQDGQEIHVVLDNLSTHSGSDIDQWLTKHPNVTLRFTPTGSSWLNQVEIWFGIITRQAIRRGTFRSLRQLINTINTYITKWNPNALHPASGSSSASGASGLGYPAPPVALPLPAGPVTTFNQGTFVVGQDIQPGTYKTIASDGGQGPATVTISSGDAAFKTTGCQTWQKVG